MRIAVPMLGALAIAAGLALWLEVASHGSEPRAAADPAVPGESSHPAARPLAREPAATPPQRPSAEPAPALAAAAVPEASASAAAPDSAAPSASGAAEPPAASGAAPADSAAPADAEDNDASEAVSSDSPAHPAGDLVRVTVTPIPERAAFFEAGKRLGTGPITITVNHGITRHLTALLNGYRPMNFRVDGTRDELKVRLRKAPPDVTRRGR